METNEIHMGSLEPIPARNTMAHYLLDLSHSLDMGWSDLLGKWNSFSQTL